MCLGHVCAGHVQLTWGQAHGVRETHGGVPQLIQPGHGAQKFCEAPTCSGLALQPASRPNPLCHEPQNLYLGPSIAGGAPGALLGAAGEAFNSSQVPAQSLSASERQGACRHAAHVGGNRRHKQAHSGKRLRKTRAVCLTEQKYDCSTDFSSRRLCRWATACWGC